VLFEILDCKKKIEDAEKDFRELLAKVFCLKFMLSNFVDVFVKSVRKNRGFGSEVLQQIIAVS